MEPTTTQVNRWWQDYLRRMFEGGGSQPFGYDFPTCCASNPYFRATYDRLNEMFKAARERERGAS